jgi:L-ribulose-5-phosphate 3-epimerase
MRLSRRRWLQLTSASLASAAVSRGRLDAVRGAAFKVGATDWNLRLTGQTSSIALAKKIGFDGVQVSLGRGGDQQPSVLPLSDAHVQQAFLAESRRVGLPIPSVCLDILHRNGLKSDPLGQRWVADAIPIARALGARVILLPFFGRWALSSTAEMDRVADILRELAPAAERAGVVLGLEDTIAARDNVRIMERAKSPAVLTYYDVGNSTNNGFDVVEEIRWLGRDRICEVHLKDNPHFLGSGRIDFVAVIGALADVGFDRWAQLETDSPTGDVAADMAVNLGYVRRLMASASTGVGS